MKKKDSKVQGRLKLLTAILVAGASASVAAAAQDSEPVVVLHSAPKHVCDPAAAAVAEIVYPVSHVEQSTPATSQRVPAVVPVATVGVPFGQVQVLPTASTTNAASVVGQVMAHDAYPAAAVTVPRPATPVASAVVTAHPSAVHAAASALAVQTLRTAVPSAGILYPALGVQQTA